ncbi:Protein ACTIVITY OF BC1 COMPLEX KINASE 8, chloroplastic [Glycine soja]
MLPPIAFDINGIKDKLSNQFRPWQRSFQFWVRAIDIYTGYKVFQVRVNFVKDAQKQEAMWERQHELAADKIFSMCYDLGGFFLKIAQIIGKPDLAPAAWVKRLVTLCDRAPPTPFDVVKLVLENELGQGINDVFDRFDVEPLGSASIAQVHRARLKGDTGDVVVKVQHPGIQDLMMTDIHNLQAFALYMQKTDIKFDLYSVTKEMEKQIGYEFDFTREANAMQRIRKFLYENNKKSPVLVPRVIHDMVTRRVLVMEYIDGIPIMNLGDEIAKRGINPHGKVATAAKQKILQSLTLAYGQMILKSGFFHADPHPGNILICKGSEASHQLYLFSNISLTVISSLGEYPTVALLDYGQVKDLPDQLRLAYANLVLAIANGDPLRAAESYRELGIETFTKCENELQELFKLAQTMFDTKLPPGVVMLQPFSEESSIKKIAVQSFPEELFSVLRTVHLLRGLSVGLGINYSCAEQWRPFAEEALSRAGRLKGKDVKPQRQQKVK